MTMYPVRLAMICAALSLPVAGYADNFDYDHTTAIAPDFFNADQAIWLRLCAPRWTGSFITHDK